MEMSPFAKNNENSTKALRYWYRIILSLVTGEGLVKGREGTLKKKKRNGMDVLADNCSVAWEVALCIDLIIFRCSFSTRVRLNFALEFSNDTFSSIFFILTLIRQ